MDLLNVIQETITGKTQTEKSMNAIDLLKADHDKVEELFKQVEDTESVARHKQLFKKIKEELEIHTHIEEKIFYPRIKKLQELKDITLEGIEEHHQAKMFLKEIPKLPPKSERFDPKLTVLMEDIRHHVKEEERQMFPKVKGLIEAEELEAIGMEMEAEKKNYKKRLAAKKRAN